MKKKMNPKEVLIPTVALLLICLIATTLLALTNSVTAEKIALNAVETEKSSRMLVMPEASSFGEVVSRDSGVTVCEALDADSNTIGYVYTAGAKGYGGTVSVMIGLDTEGTILGIEILSHGETPGLGANAVKPEFKNRFVGKSGTLTVNKTSNDGQNIQAITAATITSKAVTSAVNMALADYEAMTGGVQ
ncbi:MAG: RnfABCDGE type electron transport complex subunit G [Acutalibacteraceae bacterium]